MIDWTKLDSFPHAKDMAACVQDSEYHAEGDVWTHTKMVLDQVLASPFANDDAMRLTALYHDVAKPETRTVTYDHGRQRDRVGHPNHATRGAQIAWYDLWAMNYPLATRLEAYALCRWHQRVFHLWASSDMLRDALSFALVGSWDKLLSFAQSDNAGRISSEQAKTADELLLLADWLAEQGIAEHEFRTDHDRVFYIEKAGRYHDYHAPPPVGSEVILLCGLPGAGKDTYIAKHYPDHPVISLDNIRLRLRIKPTENQGLVMQTAWEEARVLLRERRPFIWNATCLTRLARGKIIGLCRAYDARISIHALDRPMAMIFRQNHERERSVPKVIIHSMARNYEPPSLLEAHEVKWV